MLFVKTKIKQSSVHGLGCFAEEPIAKGSVVWKFVPGFDQRLTKEEVLALPDAAQIFLATYAYKSKTTHLYVLATDNGKYINHSDTPNISGEYLRPDEEDTARALRDIAAGEEILTNYSSIENDYGTEENVLADIFNALHLKDEVDPRLKNEKAAG